MAGPLGRVSGPPAPIGLQRHVEHLHLSPMAELQVTHLLIGYPWATGKV